jgi:tetratricopeptide (TPR) repeat protein
MLFLLEGSLMRFVLLFVLAVLFISPALGQQTTDGWVDKGNALAGLGKYDEAISCYNKAIELNSSFQRHGTMRAKLFST